MYQQISISQPEDKGILLKDIIETQPVNYTIMSDKFTNRQKGKKCLTDMDKPKAANLSAREYEKNGRQGDYIACDDIGRPCEKKEFNNNSLCHHAANATDIKGNESNKRVYAKTGKAPSLTTCQGGIESQRY